MERALRGNSAPVLLIAAVALVLIVAPYFAVGTTCQEFVDDYQVLDARGLYDVS